jgi:LysM repeat protein
MLFQEAQKQALQELQREDADFQTQVQFVREQRRTLQREIEEERRAMRQFQLEGLRRNDVRERQNQRQANIAMRASTRVSGGGGRGVTQKTPNMADVQRAFETRLNPILSQKQKLQRDRDKVQALKSEEEGNKGYKNDALIAQYTKRIRELDGNIQNLSRRADNLQGQYERMQNEAQTDRQAFEKSYRDFFGLKFKSGGAPAPAQTTQPVDVEETQLEPIEVDVSPYQERIKELQTELGALEMPTRESVDLIPRQSEIYQQYFGRGAAPAPVDRSAEMDVLGVDDFEFQPSADSIEVVSTEPEPEPEPEPVVEEPQPRTYTVQRGDTLGEISQQMYGTPSRFMDIAEASGVQDPDVIREGQELTVPPSPTPPPLPEQDRMGINMLRAIRLQPERFADIGRRMRMEDMAPEPVVEQQTITIKDRFKQVANQHPNQKKLLAMQLLQEYAQSLGVTSPEYARTKKQVLQQLQQSLDPSKARQLKKVRKNQEEAPANYFNLGTMVRGVDDKTRRLVSSLFPVSDDTRVDEIESLYRNAKQQLKMSIQNTRQKRKALELLDLQYLAVLEDKR